LRTTGSIYTRQLHHRNLSSSGRSAAARSPPRAAPRSSSGSAAAMAQLPKDFTTLSNYADIRETARRYELDVDFDRGVIEGYARVEAEAHAASVNALVLDTRDLAITRVELLPGRTALPFKLGDPHKALGTPLVIALPQELQRGARVEVGIRFATAPTSTALQFLEPAQTAGGRHPYLFSQCQAIHARSLVPCQVGWWGLAGWGGCAVRAVWKFVLCSAVAALPGYTDPTLQQS